MTYLWQGGAGPRDIPQWAYRYLVTTLKADPDHLTPLKCVEQVNFEGAVLLNLIRVFDPNAVREAGQIKDFASLDQYPDLILYEGYMREGSGKVHIVVAATQGNRPPVT